jgi:carbon monoxide dehydrogenase subunit G
MTTTFKIKATPDIVFAYLIDMQKFSNVHPVISKISKTGIDSYLVHETLKFGFIPFSFTYPVKVESNEIEKTVIMKAIVMKMAKIEMHFELKPKGNYTIVSENINFETKLPIKPLLASIFRKQHAQLFKNIEIDIKERS